MSDEKEITLFENTTAGHVGVIKVLRSGERNPIAVEPHGRVELDEEEQQLTADAPRNKEDSPFEPRPYQEFDQAGNVTDEGVRPMLVPVVQQRSTPAKDAAAKAPEGQRDEREVVGA